MQTPRGNKLGSLLSAFEDNIRKNEEVGATGSGNFLTGVASSPRKLRINSPLKSPNRLVAAKNSGSSTESSISFPNLTETPTKGTPKKARRKKSVDAFAVPCTPLSSSLEKQSSEPGSNSSCSTTSVETASSVGSATKSPVMLLSPNDRKSTLTTEATENRVQTPVSKKILLAAMLKKTKSDDLKTAYISPAKVQKGKAPRRTSTGGIPNQTRQSSRRGSVDSAPGALRNASPSSPARRKLRVTEQQLDSIKRDLMMDSSSGFPSPTISPVKRARHRAIRMNVKEGMRKRNNHVNLDTPMTLPSRKSSDPSINTTTCVNATSTNQSDRSSSIRERRRRMAKRMSSTDLLRKKECELRLRKKAMMYNASDHGLKGVLKWEKKEPKNLRVVFHGLPADPPCRKQKSGRRACLDMMDSNSDDVTPKQPRRRSMSDMDSSINPLPFLRDTLKGNRGLTLFRAVVTSSIMLKRIQSHKSRAAVQIQRNVRGYLQRQHTRILILKDKLEKTEKKHQVDLAKLEAYKDRRRQEIRDKLESKFRKEEEVLAKAKELVQYIRNENKTIFEQNEKMDALSDEMRVMNQECRESTKNLFENYDAMDEAITILDRRTNQLVCACQTYESQIEHISDELSDIDRRINREKSTQTMLQKTIESIIETINGRCHDVPLQLDIQNLYQRVKEKPDPSATPILVDSKCAIDSNVEIGSKMRGAVEVSLCTELSSLFDPEETLFLERTFATVGLSMSDDDSMSFANYTFDDNDDDEDDTRTFGSTNTFGSGWTDSTSTIRDTKA